MSLNTVTRMQVRGATTVPAGLFTEQQQLVNVNATPLTSTPVAVPGFNYHPGLGLYFPEGINSQRSINQTQLEQIRKIYGFLGNLVGASIQRKAKRLGLEGEEIVGLIQKFREDLRETPRNLNVISEELNRIAATDQGSKKLELIALAYLLLNRSSVISSKIAESYAFQTDETFIDKLMQDLGEADLNQDQIERLFAKVLSAHIILTPHPTAGLTPEYNRHFARVVTEVENIAELFNGKVGTKGAGIKLDQAAQNISAIFDTMLDTPVYRTEPLQPSDETSSVIENTKFARSMIPVTLCNFEKAIAARLGKPDFELNPNIFRFHSWVARDHDGNDKVTNEEHFKAIIKERLAILREYKRDLQEITTNLTQVYTEDVGTTLRNIFTNLDKELNQAIVRAQAVKTRMDAGNRVDLEGLDQKEANKIFVFADQLIRYVPILRNLLPTQSPSSLMQIQEGDASKNYDVSDNLLKPLKQVRDLLKTKGQDPTPINILIKKIQISGNYGYHGHLRQGSEYIDLLMHELTDLANPEALLTNEHNKTAFVLQAPETNSLGVDPSATYNKLGEKIEKLQGESSEHKTENLQLRRMRQTLGLFMLSKHGAINRCLISMNRNFGNMLNALVVAKSVGAFVPAYFEKGELKQLPKLNVEIVPLTEQIDDLKTSYQTTTEALMDPAWRQYLIANRGKFIKEEGPSDSSKQNGMIPAQWEMFRAKQLDNIVVKIFNAFLQARVFGNSAAETEISAWYDLGQASRNTKEGKVITLAFDKFNELFESEYMKKQEKQIWLKAKEAFGFDTVKLIKFDTWGGPLERGGGEIFEEIVESTQPIGSEGSHERSIQGGEQAVFRSRPQSREVLFGYLNGLSQVSARKIKLDDRLALAKTADEKVKILKTSYFLDPDFVKAMDSWSLTIRENIRDKLLGIDIIDNGEGPAVNREPVLDEYFKHVFCSPLPQLGLFYSGSRSIGRSGQRIAEDIDKKFNGDLGVYVSQLPVAEKIKLLDDIRAIPYAAMFSLLGASHQPYFGAGKLSAEVFSTLSRYYAKPKTQEGRFLHYMLSCLQRSLQSADLETYELAHKQVKAALLPGEAISQSQFSLLKTMQESYQDAAQLVSRFKRQSPAQQVINVFDFDRDSDPKTGFLAGRRLNDAVVPRLILAKALAAMYQDADAGKKYNPISEQAILNNNPISFEL